MPHINEPVTVKIYGFQISK